MVEKRASKNVTRKEAEKKVLAMTYNAKAVERFMLWDNSKDMSTNAKLLGFTTIQIARQWALRHGLTYKQPRQAYYQVQASKFKKAYEGWNKNKTLQENAETIGKSLNAASFAARRYNLSYKKITAHKGTYTYRPRKTVSIFNDKHRQAKLLRDSGMTYTSIGKVFGVSRQCAEQYVAAYKRKS